MRRIEMPGLGAALALCSALGLAPAGVDPAEAQSTCTIRRVAATGGAAPGGGAYAEFPGVPSLDRGQVAFRATTATRLGVFRSDAAGGAVETLVDTLTAAPGG